MSAPEVITPEIDGRTFSGPAELSNHLITMAADRKLPVWIRCGRARHLVTIDNVQQVRRGLLIAAEMKE